MRDRPSWIPSGQYRLELQAKGCVVVTAPLSVRGQPGALDETFAGIWCVCGAIQASAAFAADWVCCHECMAWQHTRCYERIVHGAAAVAGTGVPGWEAYDWRLRVDPDRLAALEQLTKREGFMRRAELGAPEPDEHFFCWACKPIAGLSGRRAGALEALGERMELMLAMLSVFSGGYARIKSSEGKICRTPDSVVNFLKTVLLPPLPIAPLQQHGGQRLVCADLGAGNGALTRALPPGSLAVEMMSARVQLGKQCAPDMAWLCEDVTSAAFYRSRVGQFDVVISNPDFEVGLQFIYIALQLIRNPWIESRGDRSLSVKSRTGRLIFLLPSDYFEGSALRSRFFRLLDFHIEVEYKLGHLSYYEHRPSAEKRTCDSLFVLRPGRGDEEERYSHRVVNARLGGMFGMG
jgi:hypothetical protein